MKKINQFDLFLLQDLSGSFDDDLGVVRSLVPDLITAVNELQPNTPIGIGSFVDKPINPFGYLSGDYVYKTEQQLTTDASLIQNTYDSLGVRYGNDTPEAQLEALLQIALRSSEIGFRPKARRVVVLFTDASYHVAGDGAAAGITTPNNLDSVLDGLPPGTGEDYPRIEDLRKTLITNNLEIVFAVTDDQTDNYKSLLLNLRASGSVVTLSSDSSNITEAIAQGLDNLFLVKIKATSGGLVTDESGRTDTFSVVLSAQPTANVSISLRASDTTESRVSATSLVFTPVNWNLPQKVTVEGIDDPEGANIIDGNQRYQIITDTIASSDLNYNGINPIEVSVTNRDLDFKWEYIGLDRNGNEFKVEDIDFNSKWGVHFQAKNDAIDQKLPTYVYIHGWQDSAEEKNSQIMLEALSSAKANVILVDWSTMAAIKQGKQPKEAASVTKQVGETVADFLINAKASIKSTTLIGHSLGSFVAASAAQELKTLSDTKVKELVALDTAFGAFPGYDIDARQEEQDKPLDFTLDLAESTTSYTASDLIGGFATSAGDSKRASTAQNAYLIQYSKSTDIPLNTPGENGTAIHNGVIGVYADLFRKNFLHPGSIPLEETFDDKGKPKKKGDFDGVVVASLPWSYKLGNTENKDRIRSAPKAIGWANSFDDPIIYGSNADDIMFFDKFLLDSRRAFLDGRKGNDLLIANQPHSKGIDELIGGKGDDVFWIGYQRYGKLSPYEQTTKKDEESANYTINSYAVLKDFNPNKDYLRFGWKASEITAIQGSDLSRKIVERYGNGLGFIRDNNLLAYIPNLEASQLRTLRSSSRITFGQYINLDQDLFFS